MEDLWLIQKRLREIREADEHSKLVFRNLAALAARSQNTKSFEVKTQMSEALVAQAKRKTERERLEMKALAKLETLRMAIKDAGKEERIKAIMERYSKTGELDLEHLLENRPMRSVRVVDGKPEEPKKYRKIKVTRQK